MSVDDIARNCGYEWAILDDTSMFVRILVVAEKHWYGVRLVIIGWLARVAHLGWALSRDLPLD